MEATSHKAVNAITEAVRRLDKKQVKLKRALTNFKKSGCETDPCAAHLWIQLHRAILSEFAPEIVEMAAEVESSCRDVILQFEKDLQHMASREGWSLQGQWPRYFIDHVLPVTVDEKRVSISAGEHIVKTFDIEKVVLVLKEALTGLRCDQNKLSDFLKEMYNAYMKLALEQRRTVSVWELYRQMVIDRQPRGLWRDASKSLFRPFRELDFRANLTGLLKAGLTSIEGRQLRLLPPVKRDESIYIYQPAENRFAHVGRIEFASTQE